jgi:hypothetical protein
MNRRLVGVALLLGVATGIVTACSSTDSGSSAVASYEAESAGGSGEGQSPDQGQKSGGVADRNVAQPGVDRTLVRTAAMELTAADIGAAVSKARTIAMTEGGFAGREEIREETASLTLHIPSDRFDQALEDLSKLGRVISRNQTAEDVTEQVVDLDSRLASQRASVDRVRALLAQATTVDEIVRIEQELTTRESELESLEQRRQALAGQVAMSTVNISFSRPEDAPAPGEDDASGFVAGVVDGWGAFLDTGRVTLQVFGALLPFLVVLGVPAVLLFRWYRRRYGVASASVGDSRAARTAG